MNDSDKLLFAPQTPPSSSTKVLSTPISSNKRVKSMTTPPPVSAIKSHDATRFLNYTPPSTPSAITTKYPTIKASPVTAATSIVAENIQTTRPAAKSNYVDQPRPSSSSSSNSRSVPASSTPHHQDGNETLNASLASSTTTTTSTSMMAVAAIAKMCDAGFNGDSFDVFDTTTQCSKQVASVSAFTLMEESSLVTCPPSCDSEPLIIVTDQTEPNLKTTPVVSSAAEAHLNHVLPPSFRAPPILLSPSKKPYMDPGHVSFSENNQRDVKFNNNNVDGTLLNRGLNGTNEFSKASSRKFSKKYFSLNSFRVGPYVVGKTLGLGSIGNIVFFFLFFFFFPSFERYFSLALFSPCNFFSSSPFITGKVKQGTHIETGQKVAIKIIPKDISGINLSASSDHNSSPAANNHNNNYNNNNNLPALVMTPEKKVSFMKKIEREITIMRLIKHPNIIKLFDVYETNKELLVINYNRDI